MRASKNRTSATGKLTHLAKADLELIPISIAELPLWFMLRLYYRPISVSKRENLTAKEIQRHRELGGSTASFVYKHVWPAQETVVNKCLEALLMAAPPVAVANAVNRLAPSANLEFPTVCKIKRPKKLKGVTGEPDFLLFDKKNQALVVGEIKIGAKPTNGRYSFQQLRKYMQLGLLTRASLRLRHVTHIIVLPDLDVAKHCLDADYWRPGISADNRLVSQIPERFLTAHAMYQRVAHDMARVLPLDTQEFMKPVERSNPLIPIETYVVSWAALCQQLSASLVASNAAHLTDACIVQQHLGEGRFAELAH